MAALFESSRGLILQLNIEFDAVEPLVEEISETRSLEGILVEGSPVPTARDHEPLLGAGHGHIEQAAFLIDAGGIASSGSALVADSSSVADQELAGLAQCVPLAGLDEARLEAAIRSYATQLPLFLAGQVFQALSPGCT